MHPLVRYFSFGLLVALLFGYLRSRRFENVGYREKSNISPTAHYTNFIWQRHQLADSRLSTIEGYYLYYLLEPVMMFSKLMNGPTIEEQLLARHNIIDSFLTDIIESGQATQVIEIASGLSSRGLRFRQKYGDRIIYMESDLKDMIETKRNLIGSNIDSSHHPLVIIDALQNNISDDSSLHSAIITNKLKKNNGLVIITEGLLNYYNQQDIESIWKVFADELKLFNYGFYLSNIHLRNPNPYSPAQIFQRILSVFVRGEVFLLFSNKSEVEIQLKHAGFANKHILNDYNIWHDRFQNYSWSYSNGAKLVNIIFAKV